LTSFVTLLHHKHGYSINTNNEPSLGITEELFTRYMQLKTRLSKYNPYVIYFKKEYKNITIEKPSKKGDFLKELSSKWKKLNFEERIVNRTLRR